MGIFICVNQRKYIQPFPTNLKSCIGSGGHDEDNLPSLLACTKFALCCHHAAAETGEAAVNAIHLDTKPSLL